MNKKQRIENEIKRTLEQLDHQENLPANPYFYTRIQQRLEDRRKRRNAYYGILRPAWIVLLVAINLSTALWYFSGSESRQMDKRQQLIQILSDDLEIAQNESSLLIIE
ncbi:hypothetical protein GF337_11860 [candidate division KSB1 bacterium]|nr:hypothetical protein [candidate division KSB1 bacterium]